jgi:glycosyltransferase involved in cell wall biosynthesis
MRPLPRPRHPRGPRPREHDRRAVNLLIINFEMDDRSGVLAWQASVARALARSCASVLVLTDKLGGFRPEPNLEAMVLDYRPHGIPYRLGGMLLMQWRLYRLLKKRRIDMCFIHMNHPWGYRIAPLLRLLGIPSLMWYAHGTVTPSLRWALRGVTRVITSTPEGFRIPSPKVRVIGQGVDSDLFRIPAFGERTDILYVGRNSPRKRIGLLLDVMARLAELEPGSPLRLRLIGPNLSAEDREYDAEMRAKSVALGLSGRVEFVGFVPQDRIPEYYATASLHLNVSKTGSMDKTVLEALACGCPVLTGNEAFTELFRDRPGFLLASDDPEAIARRVLDLHARLAEYPPEAMRAMVAGKHDQNAFIGKVLDQLDQIGRSGRPA